MALNSHYQQSDFEVLLWNITESLGFYVEKLGLSSEQFTEIKLKFRHQDTLLQWMASRYCLQILFDRPYTDFIKNEKGKSELKDNSSELSISHCMRRIAIVKSKKKTGVDLQIKTDKLQRIATKYIDSETLKTLQASENYIDYLHVYWGIKEALFKAYGYGQLNFIEHLHIKPFIFRQKGETSAIINKNDKKISYRVFYEQNEDYYLCIVTKE
jgi:4'-phosphopantetheinyl transferase